MMKLENLFDKELARLLDQDVIREFSSIVDSVTELRFTVTDVGISSRVMSYWATEGLLFEDYREHKWRLLDLVSLVWMKMIVRMRDYGIPFETIRNIRKELQPMNLAELVLNSPSLRQVIKELANYHNENVLDLEQLLTDPNVREQVKGFIPNYLKVMILDALILRDHFAVLINHDGDFIPYKERYRDAYLENPLNKRFLQGTYLTVSITEILSEIFKAHEPEILSDDMRVITREEAAVLKAIKLPGIKTLTVRFSQGGDLDLLEITREKKVSRAARLYEIMLQDGYQEITIQTQQGNIVRCQNITRIKFSELGTG